MPGLGLYLAHRSPWFEEGYAFEVNLEDYH